MLFMNSLGGTAMEELQEEFGAPPATAERVRARVCQAILEHGSCMFDRAV